jgi:hypothetical protein
MPGDIKTFEVLFCHQTALLSFFVYQKNNVMKAPQITTQYLSFDWIVVREQIEAGFNQF